MKRITEATRRHSIGDQIISARNRHFEDRGATLFTAKALLSWLADIPGEGGPEEDHEILNDVLRGRTVNIGASGCYVRLASAEECAADGVLVSTAFMRAQRAYQLISEALDDDESYENFLNTYAAHTATYDELPAGKDAA